MAKLSEVFGRPTLADGALDKYEESADWPSRTGVEAAGAGMAGGGAANAKSRTSDASSVTGGAAGTCAKVDARRGDESRRRRGCHVDRSWT